MHYNYSWCYKETSIAIRRGRDRMVVGFTTTYAISAYHHWCCEFESRSGRGVHYVIKFVWLATGRWFSLGPPVSSTNKTERHDITEILLKVALNTIKPINRNPGPRMYLIRPWIRPFIQYWQSCISWYIKIDLFEILLARMQILLII